MRRLRKRPRLDKLSNDVRKQNGSVGRRVYLILLVALVIGLLNFLWGEILLFHADGLVIEEKNVVSAAYTVRIEETYVDQGESVKQHEVIMKLGSPDILESIADLASQVAQLAQRRSELKTSLDTANALLPIAKRRATAAENILSQYESTKQNGLITNSELTEAYINRFNSEEALAKYDIEKKTLQSEIDSLDDAMHAAMTALSDLRAHYSEGVIRAPTSGTVGTETPSVGDVYRAGEPILSIYVGDKYILAYLPSRYLFSIKDGMRVRISNGRASFSGAIIEILPVSEALPKEFQNTFKPRDRNRLAKIAIDTPEKLSLYEKVNITYDYAHIVRGFWRNEAAQKNILSSGKISATPPIRD